MGINYLYKNYEKGGEAAVALGIKQGLTDHRSEAINRQRSKLIIRQTLNRQKAILTFKPKGKSKSRYLLGNKVGSGSDFFLDVDLDQGKIHKICMPLLLSVPKFTANMYCICLSIPKNYSQADSVQICGKLWGTQ